jgi:hypothetical protein
LECFGKLWKIPIYTDPIGTALIYNKLKCPTMIIAFPSFVLTL